MIAVVVVRDGELPLGADETIAEAGGRVLLVGTGVPAEVPAAQAFSAELGPFAVGAYAAAVAPFVADEDVVLLPGSPDGRDLAPRLAHLLGRPLHAPALSVCADRVVVARHARTETFAPAGPFVATLQPGCRGADPLEPVAAQAVSLVPESPPDAAPVRVATDAGPRRVATDAVSTGTLPADPATMDLADATRIVAAGAGLGSRESADLLQQVATALGASYGATRVVTDLGWAPFERQIGTTGVVVHPGVYVAVGISGAVQHVTGIGQPDTVVAVNTDASCPMMAMADLAVVTDAPAFVAALAQRLGLAVPDLEEARS